MSKEKKKKHAIEFVHFVLSNPVYKFVFNENTIFPEEIYEEFLKQKNNNE